MKYLNFVKSLFLVFVITGWVAFAPSQTQAQTPNLDKWVGKYSYAEDAVPGVHGTSLVMIWDLEISKSNTGYSGKLSINGYQTLIEDLTDITGNEKEISIKFVKQTDGPVYDYGYKPKIGALLFTLSNVNGKLVTHWAGESPHLRSNAKKVGHCFVLEKRR